MTTNDKQDHSVQINESIIWCRHDTLNLLDSLNQPHIDQAEWWKRVLGWLNYIGSWETVFNHYQELQEAKHAQTKSSSL